MRPLIALAAMILAACSGIEQRPVKTGIDTVTIQLVRDYNAGRICSGKVGVAPGWKIQACAEMRLTHCTIYLPPDGSDELLGHEARHCFDGAWHK